MVRNEQACCAFLRFEIAEAVDDVRVTITVPEQARDDVDGIFDQFTP
jgi:hypothetical protein